MEEKTDIVEKRVKSTVIRRRTVVKPVPTVAVPTELEKQEAVPAAAVKPSEEKVPEGEAPVAVAGGLPETEEAKAAAKLPRKPLKKRTRDEIEMEMIERAGGLRRAAELMQEAPEKLERVYRPDKTSKKRRMITKKEFKKTEITQPKAIKKVIRIEETIQVGELAHRMGVKSGELVKKLFDLGVMATLNQAIDLDTAVILAHDFGYEVENVAFTEGQVLQGESSRDLQSRAPIVTVMGHVDHGKTSLLDAIRKTNVAAGEAGGITQHIGAYEVMLPKGKITFLDTPGHEAFTAIRARGAKVTDIVILVVAADDGVMPQTIEAINHAKAAKVPIVVAINKIDKQGADPSRVERQLMEHQLISEKLGGETIFVPLSAKTGKGLEDLLEMLLLQSEVLDLKADRGIRAQGIVIEARLDRGRGPIASLLVQKGTLRLGDPVVVGESWGGVRAMTNALGESVEAAGPSEPVEIQGLSEIPAAGDLFDVARSEEDARDVAEHRQQKSRLSKTVIRPKLEDFYKEAQGEEKPELRILIKADVHGSAEALRDSLMKLSSEKVTVNVIHFGVGAITESDVMLALASKAIIAGFNVRPDNRGREIAEKEKVQIRKYSIIYEVIDDIRKAMEGLLKPIQTEEYLGRAEVRQLFKVGSVGLVAGSAVVDGKIVRTAPMRILRDGKVVYEGRLGSLKRFKEDAREVTAGLECGIGVENFNDVKVGDLVESYRIQEVAAKL